jgi:hypothetical protein
MERALEADGEKLRQLTGEDHGPVFLREMTMAYDDGFSEEAQHTTFVLMETFSRHVMDTPCAAEFPDVKELAERVHGLMFELYQLIGEKITEPKP